MFFQGNYVLRHLCIMRLHARWKCACAIVRAPSTAQSSLLQARGSACWPVSDGRAGADRRAQAEHSGRRQAECAAMQAEGGEMPGALIGGKFSGSMEAGVDLPFKP